MLDWFFVNSEDKPFCVLCPVPVNYVSPGGNRHCGLSPVSPVIVPFSSFGWFFLSIGGFLTYVCPGRTWLIGEGLLCTPFWFCLCILLSSLVLELWTSCVCPLELPASALQFGGTTDRLGLISFPTSQPVIAECVLRPLFYVLCFSRCFRWEGKSQPSSFILITLLEVLGFCLKEINCILKDIFYKLIFILHCRLPRYCW